MEDQSDPPPPFYFRTVLPIDTKFGTSREHEGTERDTEGVGCDMSLTCDQAFVGGAKKIKRENDTKA